MKYKILKILSFLLVVGLLCAAPIFYGIYISPDKLVVKYDTISSAKIPTSLDNITIGYFSDIYYLEFMNDERLDKMINKMNDANVDVLLFGGDLFADATNPAIGADVINKVSGYLTKLEAPLGKFFVLGEKDNVTPDTRTLVSTILYNSGFEELTNKNTKIHNGNNESVALIGLDNELNGTMDIQSAFTNTSKDTFNILFMHTPDSINAVAIDTIDLAVAGHSLGGQLNIPLFGALHVMEGARKYNHGTYNINKTILRVSNGLGTIKTDMRLLCPPEFNIFVLHKK